MVTSVGDHIDTNSDDVRDLNEDVKGSVEFSNSSKQESLNKSAHLLGVNEEVSPGKAHVSSSNNSGTFGNPMLSEVDPVEE